jgi:cyclic pyranopterin phosphate synthase
MAGRLSHLDEAGAAHMVDVGGKPETARRAVAEGRIRLAAGARAALLGGTAAKGDALAVARVAGIMAAKRTAELIPLCHPVALTSVTIGIEEDVGAIRVRATAATNGPTGVEMEALVAATAALLTLYDMGKAIDRAMVIEGVRLIEKDGGRSGRWRADD